MIKTFTQDDLIRYIYRETTTKENIEIESALIFDAYLSEEYSSLCQTVDVLNSIEKSPSYISIDKILSYSKSYDLHSMK